MAIMVAGRPRTEIPSPEECVELGKDFVQWATEETSEWRCLVQQWYCLKHGISRRQWKLLKLAPEFSPYYEMGMVAMAKKAVDGSMEKSFGHRYLRLYCQDLRDEENEQLAYEAELKKKEETKENNITIKIVDYSEKAVEISSDARE